MTVTPTATRPRGIVPNVESEARKLINEGYRVEKLNYNMSVKPYVQATPTELNCFFERHYSGHIQLYPPINTPQQYAKDITPIFQEALAYIRNNGVYGELTCKITLDGVREFSTCSRSVNAAMNGFWGTRWNDGIFSTALVEIPQSEQKNV